MNIWFKIGKFFEDRKAVKNLDFEQRIRQIEQVSQAQMKLGEGYQCSHVYESWDGRKMD